MPVTHFGTSTPVVTTGAATIGWPSGHTAGDLALLFVASKSGQSPGSPPTGWAALPDLPIDFQDIGSGSANGTTLTGYYKFAVSGSESSVTLNDPGNYTIASLSVYRGVDLDSPFAYNQASGFGGSPSKGSSGAPFVGDTFTSVGTNTHCVFAISLGDDDAGGWSTGATLSGVGDASPNIRCIETVDGGSSDGTLIVADAAIAANASSYTPSLYFSSGATSTRATQVMAVYGLKPIVVAAIAGTSSSSASSSAVLKGTGALIGAGTCVVVTAAALLIGSVEISGSSTSTVNSTGNISATVALSGSSLSTVTSVGSITGLTDSNMVGASISGTTSSANLTAVGALVGSSSSGASTAPASLQGMAAAVGSSSSTATSSAALSALYGMQGSGTSTVTTAPAELTSSFSLQGVGTSVASSSAQLTGFGYMQGSSVSVASSSVSAAGKSPLFGRGTATVTSFANLSIKTNPTVVLNFRNQWLAVYSSRQALLNKITGLTKTDLLSQSTLITTLTNRVDSPTTGLAALSTATTALDSRVSLVEGVNTSQSSNITALSNALVQKTTTFAQGTAPDITGRVIGDLWIDTSDGNKLYTWNGSTWLLRPLSAGAKTWYQNDPPASGMQEGDLWFDANDNNKQYRYTASVWVLISDVRIAATATAVTALTNRVVLTENAITAQSGVNTTLTNAIADKASVTAVTSLTTRVETVEGIYNVNLLPNSGLVVNAMHWGVLFWNSAGTPNWFIERDALGVGYRIANTHNIGVYNTGTPAAGQFFVAGTDATPCTAGYEYFFSAAISSANTAHAEARIYFYTAALGYLGEVGGTPTSVGYTGGTNPANWVWCSGKVTAPAGAAFMRLGLLTQTNGAANPRAHMTQGMIERARPGQTVRSVWNQGSAAAWAEWDVNFDVNGYISGMSFASDGRSTAFVVSADVFQVKAPLGGPSLTWENGTLWNKGTTYSFLVGQGMGTTNDVLIYAGPNPTSKATLTKEGAAFYVDEAGNAGFSGLVNQSLLSGSAMELGSTRIHTGGGRLAPFTVREFSYKGQGNGQANFSATVSLPAFQSPNIGEGYHHLRLSRQKCDVVMDCVMHGDGSGGESVVMEVQYDGGAWVSVASRSGINVDYRGAWTFLIRYTTLETWNTVAFRARTTNGNTICLAFSVVVDNTNESGNPPGSVSGLDATTGGGGSAPPPPGGGGGGGGGGSFCVHYDSMLPDGRYLRDVQVGDLIECVDVVTGDRTMEPLLAMSTGYEDCYVVTTKNAQVIQSKSTPMTMRDGSTVRTPELQGMELLTHNNGWQVCVVTSLGKHKVLKPDLGDRMFFAGLRADTTLATHNIRDKDIGDGGIIP